MLIIIDTISCVAVIRVFKMNIDLVYLWVDGSDENWRAKKLKYTDPDKIYNKDAVAECRFADYDELKYSIRSAEQNLPWINKIS